MTNNGLKRTVTFLVAISLISFSIYALLVQSRLKGCSINTMEAMNNAPFKCPDNSVIKVERWGPYNGVMRSCEQEGKRNGPWEAWENNFKNVQGSYQDDIAAGKWTVWHDNKTKYSEIFYSSGVINGEAIFWHINGQIESKGLLKNNLRHGKWIFWEPNGAFKKEIDFRLGVPVNEFEAAKKDCPSGAILEGPLYCGSDGGIGLAKLLCKSEADSLSKVIWVRKFDKDGNSIK